MEDISAGILSIMPTYSYQCEKCQNRFELFFYIKDYIDHPKCEKCHSKQTHRRYVDDVITQSTSVRKSDTELKTLGDLAKRNSDRMSEDEKTHLYHKHNEYKFDESTKTLPTGMSRIKKPEKIKWPGSKGKTKRGKK
jgi:putative FmdB family regulatory protein